MKKLIILLFVLASGAMTFAAETAQPAPSAASAAVKTASASAPAPVKEEPGIALCLCRGICNIATGWLEIPRCMIYDNTFVPILGLLIGIPEGAFLTIGREFCGVFDIISFGTSGSTCHGEVFPDTVFQSKWIYRRK